ncbi:hypothetical protein [Streptomyces albipurpureus]|uniref:Uncharacterized protein n=1 Tax=Streptomyces albipurpureus TaxID=2897419 RepID=A0ABT0UFV2_9ACTN|nr:hypothetical protein [Streptomyces sp. CWNU-1]MCM2387288.1 hypothetical protein [Streptomyces sp. CWNU-1]
MFRGLSSGSGPLGGAAPSGVSAYVPHTAHRTPHTGMIRGAPLRTGAASAGMIRRG